MAIPPGDSCVQACPNCATLVDISEQEPLAKFDCPNCGAPMRASRKYNHFSIIEHLGTGGMGAVYKALDRNLNRMVALKLLRKELSADESYIAKLEDEARITASINHPFVVKVFSFGSDTGQYYIAMELVDKGSLDDLMQLQNRIAELQVLQVGLQVASGLQAAHEKGLIHRDVKPGNILFADARTAKITDFGLALLAEHEADARGEIWGTPYYIAPEKLNNEPEDFRSDIYSLGGTLFHAVAGRPPFEAETASLVALKHLKSRAVSLQAFAPDVSGETAYVINRMLHKDPNQRYNSYGELTDHFRYAIDQLNANVGKPRATRERVVVESRSQNHVAGILTLVLLCLIVAAIVSAYVFRARLFGEGASPANAAAAAGANPQTATADTKVTPEASYEAARHQIVEEKYTDAQESFRLLAQQPALGQPLTNWVRLHQGMAALLNHQSADSRALFGALQNGGLYSTDSKQRALANFFVETGRFLADSHPIPASVVNSWDKNTFEAAALLLFGLKDWEQADFDDADALFKAFLDGKPGEPYRWISDYGPIARKAAHDFALYAPLRDRFKNGGDRAALRADLAKARSQLQTTGKMVEAFFAAETELSNDGVPSGSPVSATNTGPVPGPGATPGGVKPPAAPSPAPPAAVANREHDAETVRWQTARESYEQMVALSRFDEAQSVLEHVQLSDPDYTRARDLTVSRARTLVAFKKTLSNDFNSPGGYPQPVTSRRGTTYPRGIVNAAPDMLQAGTPYGTIGVPWTDFAPAALLTVAGYYTDATRDPRQAAERRWLAAVYALENGRAAEAKALAARAARDLPQHQKDLGQFNATVGTGIPAQNSP